MRLEFSANAWSGTLEVTEVSSSCPGTPVSLNLSAYASVEADAGPDADICFGQPVQIGTPSGIGGSGDYSYSWSPAVGLSDPSAPQPMANPPVEASPVTYTLTVTDIGTGCATDTDEVVISVSSSPVVSIQPSTTSGCSPLTVDFRNQSQNVFINNWYWREQGTTDQNEIMTSFDVTYEFVNNSTTSKVFEVVYLGSTGTCADEQIVEINVEPTVQADFTISPGNILVIDDPTITITNNSVNKNTLDHLWEFGDGSTSTDVDPAPHTYGAFGQYNLTLTLTDPNTQCSSTQTELIIVQAVAPVVDFDDTPSKGCRPLTVQFNNESFSVDPNSYEWVFTNQFGQVIGTSTEENPLITFYDAGTVNVSLTGTNPLGMVDTKTVIAMVEVFDLPTASFSVSPETVYLPDQLLFTNNLSSLADEFEWDFDGDGITDSEEFEPNFLYQQEGLYDVSLIARNSDSGCADTLVTPEAVNVVISGVTDIPNGFFPVAGNGGGGNPGAGGPNSIFLPKTYGVREDGFIMQIFDRWGHLLFESKDKSVGWNGLDGKGRLYPSGVYVVKLELTYLSGERSVVVGDVTLIR